MGGITNETVHLSFAVHWSKEVNPLLDSNNKSQQFTVPIYKDTVQKSPNGGRSIGEHKERLLRILTDWGIDISWNDLLSESSVFFIELINMLYYLEVERACTEMHNQLWKKALSPEEY